ncbi:MAG: putative hydro-lyase [Deltaproteobacteria bacterium]|nr:putative hydro-lyase [Deltaproteobacteria bacterium]MBM4323117.1 putative hydro-lyase [Deltaproteobacteria bacterium]MBM4346802.1 putative hydro-lyase [Deltaproteobacteria bacterium]
MRDVTQLRPKEIRSLIRKGKWDKPTAGLAMGYAQANLVILPEKYAFDFLLFCQRNPKPCPLLEVLEPGRFRTGFLSKEADIRTDIPRYNVYPRGRLESTVKEIRDMWKFDWVTFLLGCSFSFEEALLRAKVPVRHIEENKNVPMFISSIACQSAGVFHGPMVVTMRPIPLDKVSRAVQITSRYVSVHGAPVHIGDPSKIGIRDLKKPDFGDPVTIKKGEVPVFWACGVTPQAVVMKAKPDLCITHTPGHMFISDLLNEELATL